MTGADAIEERYLAAHPASAAAFRAAERVMPGGTSRQAGYWAPFPLTLARGAGTCVWDVDGQRYFDLINNYSALVHGHAFPPVVEAVARQIAEGSAWTAGNHAATALAASLVARVPTIEQVRFTNSGTEAAALAFSVARVATGRAQLLMARYGYHGSLLEFERGSFGHEGPCTRLAGFNDPNDFAAVLDRHGSDIAAVFLEPVLGSGGIVEGTPAFLHGVQAAARRAGAVFVLDEVLSLRFATGGRGPALGLEPDLTLFGKLIGGGFPIGAVGGRRELLAMLAPRDGRLFHTGTFNANPVSMTAGRVALDNLGAAEIARIDTLCARLAEGLAACAARHAVPLSLRRVGSCCNLYLSDEAPAASAERTDGEAMRRFHLAALNRGLMLAPRGMVALSTAWTAADVETALGCFDDAFADFARHSQR